MQGVSFPKAKAVRIVAHTNKKPGSKLPGPLNNLQERTRQLRLKKEELLFFTEEVSIDQFVAKFGNVSSD